MAIKIKRCVKKYNRGISKVISPEQTYRKVLKRIKKIEPEIFVSFREIKSRSGIPQYFIRGTDYYSQLVNDIGRVGPSMNANGKGHFKKAALVSGLMEMAERYSCCKYFFECSGKQNTSSFDRGLDLEKFYSIPYYRKDVDILRGKYVKSAKVIHHKGQKIDGIEVQLPVSLITYTYQYTNGMASGNTVEEALSHGICEVIERHCKTVVREERISPPEIDQSTIKSVTIKELIAKFQSLGDKIILKDVSLDTGIPVIAVLRKIDGRKYLLTVGSAPSREEAMIRALVENSQIENDVNSLSRKEIENYLKSNKKISYEDLPNLHNNDIKKEILIIDSLLKKQSMEIFFVDTTDEKLKIPSVFVYITNAKRHSSEIGFRNIAMGLIEESLRIKELDQATKFLNLGKRNDKKNIGTYYYYSGLLKAFNREYKKAIGYFKKSLNHSNEFIPITGAVIGVCYLALGDVRNTMGYFVGNTESFPNIRFSSIRTHHKFDEKLFESASKVYNALQENNPIR